jgi:hypothetical protein
MMSSFKLFCAGLGMSFSLATILVALFSSSVLAGPGGLCTRTKVKGVVGCSMKASDPCPPSIPICGAVTGGDGCSCL